MCESETIFHWTRAQAIGSFETHSYRAWLACDTSPEPTPGPESSSSGDVLVSLIFADHGDPSALRDTIGSLGSEGPATEVVVVDRSFGTPRAFSNGPATRVVRTVAWQEDLVADHSSALAAAKGKFIGFVSPGDRLPAGTLSAVEQLLSGTARIDVLYTDEDWFDDEGRCRPRFKTAWDPEAHLGFDLLGRLCLMRRDLVLSVGGMRPTFSPAHRYDLHLRVAAASRASAICHLPRVCYSRRIPSQPPTDDASDELAIYASCAGMAAAEAASRFVGSDVIVKPADAVSFSNRVFWPLPVDAPLASVIVPVRDRNDLLKTCANGVLNETDYRNLNLVIVDNGSTERETLDLLRNLREDPRVQVIRDDGPFNFSRLVNLGARHARGSVLALLNNDVEVVTRSWLSDLVALANRCEIGCVGAKLLYGDRKIQHAGVALQTGPMAIHVFRLLDEAGLGYDGQPVSTRAYLAVTAACMVVRRSVFDAVGGFDERFEVAFNDVDFCLKVADLGYLNVCSPHEPLLHHEGSSRGHDTSAEHRSRFMKELALLQARWNDRIAADPFGSPNVRWDWNEGFRLNDGPQSFFVR